MTQTFITERPTGRRSTLCVALGALLLLFALRANAAYIEVRFFYPDNQSTCNTTGNSGDSGCSVAFGHVSDDDVRSATMRILGQASADRSSCYLFWCPPDATADLLLKYVIPVAVFRAVEYIPQADGSFTVVVPRPTISLKVSISGDVRTNGTPDYEKNFGTFYGVDIDADAFLGGKFGGLSQETNDSDPEWHRASLPFVSVTFLNYLGESDASWDLLEGESIGEIDKGWQIPYNSFGIWRDEFAPYATYEGNVINGFFQYQIGYLTLYSRMTAQSRDGNESITCFGLKSELDDFWPTDTGCEGGGIELTASVRNFLPPYTFTVAPPGNDVPEPGTLALFGFGLAGLGFVRRRKA